MPLLNPSLNTKLRNISLVALFLLLLSGAFFRDCLAADDFKFGVQLFDRSRFKESKEVFQKVVRKNPKNTNAIYYLAASLQNSGDVPNAIKFYNHLVRSHPRSPAAQYARKALNDLKKSGHSGSSRSSSRRQGDYIPDQESIPFRRGGDNHLRVNCQLNGRSLSMIFDTGAETCLVGKNTLRKLGVSAPEGRPTSSVNGVGGSVPAWSMYATISLGKIRKTIPITVIENFDKPLLGQTFFGNFKYNIDNASGTIKFRKPGGKADYVPNDTIDIPFRNAGNNIIVVAKVNGKPMRLYFDTGAQGTLMTTQAQLRNGSKGWRHLGFSGSSGVGGSRAAALYEVDSIELGPIRKTRMRVAVSSGLQYGLLGQDFFGRRRYVIDREKSLIRFYR